MSRWPFPFGSSAKPLPPHPDRAEYLAIAEKLMQPFLAAPAGNIRAVMPIDMPTGGQAKLRGTGPLEGLCRMIAGIAPALEARVLDYTPWHRMLAVAFDPASDGYLVRPQTNQTLVELALLAQAIIAAPNALWKTLPETTRTHMLSAFVASRKLRPWRNNWLLFAAMIEALLFRLGQDWDAMRVEYAVEQHMAWYKGDGVYGDGASFHADYYNSIMIHPLMLDVLRVLSPEMRTLKHHQPIVLARARRYAETLERLIAPDGSFPPLGRSLAYRCGLFHLLSRLALYDQLPPSLPPTQIRTALLSIARRTLLTQGSFGPGGWLTIGLNGRDVELGEQYINSGSVYFASLVLLPLGLPEQHPFWVDPPGVLTQTRLWSEANEIPRDAAMSEDVASPKRSR
ncbi:MAG: DUF2264 domain-containing protein [Tabrizicola sp.]|nr:DUF2264 domain-containing protein [Tabrizicola sp.]